MYFKLTLLGLLLVCDLGQVTAVPALKHELVPRGKDKGKQGAGSIVINPGDKGKQGADLIATNPDDKGKERADPIAIPQDESGNYLEILDHPRGIELTAEESTAGEEFDQIHPGGRPSAKYAPRVSTEKNACPSEMLREDTWTLSGAEKDWLNVRHKQTSGAYKQFIGRVFPKAKAARRAAQTLAQKHGAPVVAIAVSSGGIRSLLHAAGVIRAWQDDPLIGNLADTAIYLTGNSGGSFLVASLAVNGWMSVSKTLDIVKQGGTGLWDFSPTAWAFRDAIVSKLQRYIWLPIKTKVEKEISALVKSKAQVKLEKSTEKFRVTSTDYWGRRLAMQLFYDPDSYNDGRPGYTWSRIAKEDVFRAGKMPMPILTAAGFGEFEPGKTDLSLDLPVYEFSPFEWGTQNRVPEAAHGNRNGHDNSLPGSWWMSTQYMGTRIDGGSRGADAQQPLKGNCVTGFDDAGFVVGTSSSVFNSIDHFIMEGVRKSGVLKLLPSLANIVHSTAGFVDENDQIDRRPQAGAAFIPDPRSATRDLVMVDGGMTGEKLGLEPLLRPERNVQIILAIDSGNDWMVDPLKRFYPQGLALLNNAKKNAVLNRLQMPVPGLPTIPDDDHMFGELGRIRFFGCDPEDSDKPLIVYLPNHDWNNIELRLKGVSNIDTTVLSMSGVKRDLIIDHGYALGKGAGDPELFAKCVGCAMLWRSAGGQGDVGLPNTCSQCYEKYCFPVPPTPGTEPTNPWA